MISELYAEYFQKSTSLLYPILGFSKSHDPKPLKTYVSWEGKYTIADKKLIVVYEKKDPDKFLKFERDKLQRHALLNDIIQISDTVVAYVFDFNKAYTEDYDNFIQGKYSKLSTEAKASLGTYFGMHTPEWVYIESYVFPEKYFKDYAQILDVEESFLRSVGELCEKYDPIQECCTHPVNCKV